MASVGPRGVVEPVAALPPEKPHGGAHHRVPERAESGQHGRAAEPGATLEESFGQESFRRKVTGEQAPWGRTKGKKKDRELSRLNRTRKGNDERDKKN